VILTGTCPLVLGFLELLGTANELQPRSLKTRRSGERVVGIAGWRHRRIIWMDPSNVCKRDGDGVGANV
jgi:hypothetical protein